MSSSGPSFFPPSSELGVLEAHVRRLQASAHAPPLDRAEQVLADIRGAVLRTHEAQLQVSIATSAGFDEHRRVWQAKIAAIEKQIVDATLLGAGADRTLIDSEGNTPRDVAVAARRNRVVQLLDA